MFKKLLQYKKQLLNASLRLIPMATKLGLTLYMGRFFNLSDIGTYGLVIGAVTILGIISGQDFIYFVSRDIVGDAPATALHKMRDQAIHYGFNYVILAVIMIALMMFHILNVTNTTMAFVLVLTVLESFSTVCYYNLNSRNRQVQANTMFFIRAGLWVFPVIGLCILKPELRTTNTILCGWTLGTIVSLIATIWFWRKLPWRNAMLRPVDWEWIRKGLKKSIPIWVGIVGVTAGSFLDRFVVQHYLTLEDVGVLTFYFSFTNALLTLAQSGVAAFATPRLIKHHRDGNTVDFTDEAQKACQQIAIGTGFIAIILGLFVPAMGHVLNRPSFIAGEVAFWLMLLGTWIRANAEMLNNILYARHQDRSIWVGNILFLAPALGGNLLLVSWIGFNGVGYSSVVASAFLYIWRLYFVKRDSKSTA